MNRDRILAIEDDEGVCRLLRHSLAREDYQVRIVHTGEDGLTEALADPPDLFLLDLELPGIDGLIVCQKLKQDPITRAIPVIILTGKGEEVDVVQGLEMGADDYIVKPFSPKILNARVQAVLRRRIGQKTSPVQDEVLQLGSLIIDTARNSIRISGNELELNPAEYRFVLLLACYLSGEKLSDNCLLMLDDEEPVSVISREGMALYSENRLGRLLPIFEGFVDSGYQDSATLSKFYGLALFEKNPGKARSLLAAAEQKFQAKNQPLGELVALAHLVFFHIVIDGNLKQAAVYLERAETLNQAFFDRLSVFSRVAVAQNLALGRSFILHDFAGAGEYLSIAEALAEDRGLINLVVINRLVRIFQAYVAGDREAMVDGIEDSFRFVNHPQVSRLHKLLLKLSHLKYFSLTGDFNYLRLQEQWLQEEFREQLTKDNFSSTQLIICRLESLMLQRRQVEALALCSESLLRPAVIANDLVRPLLNGFKALSAALCGEKQALKEAVDVCRSETGRLTFRLALAKLFCARALALSGKVDEAESILGRITPVIEEQGWHNLALQARAQQLLLQQDPNNEQQRDAVGALLTEMQEREVWYLQTLIDDDYYQLFRLAVEAEAGESQARAMVRRRLLVEFDEEGDPYPLLQLSTLGGLKIALGDTLVARTDEFSRTQRECLTLLVAAPDHRITQEEVQLAFWPDSQPEKARSTLDTMLSRFRRNLKSKLKPYPVKKFLKLQKGVLSLESVIIDAVEVKNGIGKARELMRRRELWQADVAFSLAFSKWHGLFMPGSCSADQSAAYARKLQQLCIDASLEWSELLNESGQIARAIEILSHALAMDRSNEALMRALYRSYMRDGNIARAHQLLQQYEEVFRSEGYSPSETARILASLKSPGKLMAS